MKTVEGNNFYQICPKGVLLADKIIGSVSIWFSLLLDLILLFHCPLLI